MPVWSRFRRNPAPCTATPTPPEWVDLRNAVKSLMQIADVRLTTTTVAPHVKQIANAQTKLAAFQKAHAFGSLPPDTQQELLFYRAILRSLGKEADTLSQSDDLMRHTHAQRTCAVHLMAAADLYPDTEPGQLNAFRAWALHLAFTRDPGHTVVPPSVKLASLARMTPHLDICKPPEWVALAERDVPHFAPPAPPSSPAALPLGATSGVLWATIPPPVKRASRPAPDTA